MSYKRLFGKSMLVGVSILLVSGGFHVLQVGEALGSTPKYSKRKILIKSNKGATALQLGKIRNRYQDKLIEGEAVPGGFKKAGSSSWRGLLQPGGHFNINVQPYVGKTKMLEGVVDRLFGSLAVTIETKKRK